MTGYYPLGHERHFFDDVSLALAATHGFLRKKQQLDFVHQHIIHREEMIVAQKKQNQSRPDNEWAKAKWLGFSNVPVSDSDMGDIDAWARTADIDSLMDAMIGDGYKISLSLVDNGDTVMVGFHGAYKRTGENAGLFLSSYAPDIKQALIVALYKHFVICDGGNWPKPNTARVGRIG